MKTLFPLIKSALALTALGFAIVAQYLHTYYHADLVAIVLFVIALGLWLACIASSSVTLPFRLREPIAAGAPNRHVSMVLAVSTVILALFAFFFASGNQFTVDNLMAWIGSIVAFLAISPDADVPERLAWMRTETDSIGRSLMRAAIVFVIMAIGAIFCFYNLDTVPSKTDARHSERLVAIDNVINANTAPIYFTEIPGGEPLQIYLTAALTKLNEVDVDALMLRTLTALVGILVIPLTFLLARELFNSELALIAAFLVAISKWNFALARMGLPFVFATVFVAATMFFLIRAFKYKNRDDFLAAGISLGVGLFGYSAFRIVPLFVLGVVLVQLLRVILARDEVERFVKNSALMFGIALLISIPILRFAIEQPKEFVAPVAYLVLDDPSNDDNPIINLGSNMVNTAAMFNWTGDTNPYDSVPNDPAFDYLTGAAFLLGAVYCWYRLVRFREPVYAFLLAGLAVMLMPSLLNVAHPSENPNLTRAAGAIPFAIIIAALPLAWLVQSIRDAFSNSMASRAGAIIILLVLLLISARANFLRYFNDYAPSNTIVSVSPMLDQFQIPPGTHLPVP